MLRVPTVENEIKEVKEIEINHIIDLRDLMDQGKESILEAYLLSMWTCNS